MEGFDIVFLHSWLIFIWYLSCVNTVLSALTLDSMIENYAQYTASALGF
ncbi:hypothetical protein PPEP_a4107 [Pseudoalteromonas peptidolytica F12-50-A1]|uniref:Uncharacterized protein n=1 Tax=Pseudoalteromonas peptidolytica F12-50-A1 TaxID=1315280 RepID=A0A8I0MSG6_9GAMM|nr:hypothetical protein [Pseudoalteromonas peptidolytica F12-50-A1]